MFKIYYYELRRLLVNKFFLCLLLITAFYSYQTMSGEIILGIADTAPFSGWSYGVYLAKVLPLLLVSLLFFISFLYLRKEMQVKVLTQAAPFSASVYRLIKTSAITSAFILISLVPIAISCWFYAAYFHLGPSLEQAAACLYTLVPAAVFTLGLGLLLGRLQPLLIYACMAAALVLDALPISFDLYGLRFLSSYPLTLKLLDPIFQIPLDQLIQRLLLIGVGLLMVLAASRLKNSASAQ